MEKKLTEEDVLKAMTEDVALIETNRRLKLLQLIKGNAWHMPVLMVAYPALFFVWIVLHQKLSDQTLSDTYLPLIAWIIFTLGLFSWIDRRFKALAELLDLDNVSFRKK